ncbi:hypothetical protein Hanom_Chr02g00133621 [Helianthus anomalus]
MAVFNKVYMSMLKKINIEREPTKLISTEQHRYRYRYSSLLFSITVGFSLLITLASVGIVTNPTNTN